MRILALNCGSSSIKSAVVDTDRGRRVLDIRITEIARPSCRISIDGEERPLPASTDVGSAIELLLAEVRERLASEAMPVAIVHRVVHGGERFRQPTLLDAAVLAEIESLSRLAPLHNPPALAAARAARALLPDVPQVAVFDTAFHATLPRQAREYALPERLRSSFDTRRYGFHGISHAHVMQTVATYLRTDAQRLRIVSCHLGNGASATAIEYGRSVDTSMGMTPLEGLVMGSRAGDVDAGVLLQLMRSGISADDLDSFLNYESGLVGLTGTNDMRDIERRAMGGDEECRLAIALYTHRIRKYIGAYAATMGGVDVIAFTGGVGEHSPTIRHRCLQRLEFLGVALDEDRNRDARLSDDRWCCELTEPGSRTRVLVVRADEEFSMSLAAAELLQKRAPQQLSSRIPIAVSARHAHLSQATIERLFGAGHQLTPGPSLSQVGHFAASETVTLIGPRGRLEKVRLLGPPPEADQVEISRSDEFVLGVDAPVRISGDLGDTPGITLEGPAGRVDLASGVFCPRRHIRMNETDAGQLGVHDRDVVAVKIASDGRELVFGDVLVRVGAEFALELHLDTDEANAARVRTGDFAVLVPRSG